MFVLLLRFLLCKPPFIAAVFLPPQGEHLRIYRTTFNVQRSMSFRFQLRPGNKKIAFFKGVTLGPEVYLGYLRVALGSLGASPVVAFWGVLGPGP